MFPVTVSIDHVVIMEEVVTCVPVTDIIDYVVIKEETVTFKIDHIVIKE